MGRVQTSGVGAEEDSKPKSRTLTPCLLDVLTKSSGSTSMISVGTGDGGPTKESREGVGRYMSEGSPEGCKGETVEISLCFLLRELFGEEEVVVVVDERDEVVIFRLPATPVGIVICRLEERWRAGDGI